MTRTLTHDTARRISLAAQGFTMRRPSGRIDARHYRRVFKSIGVVQLDSVNVVSRTHYLPMFARLGPYDRDAFDRWTTRGSEVYEYWGHEASLLELETYPLLRHRMADMGPWRSIERLETEHPGYVDEVLREVSEYGPVTVSDLADPGKRTGPWWGYGRGKIALEWLFATGRIASYRNRNFARVYDLPERVIPDEVRTHPPVPKTEAYRALLLRAAAHHGVGTARDLADYYRLHVPTARPIVAEMAAAGVLEEVRVEGWAKPAYVHPGAVRPRRVEGRALLSPFDSLIWERDRTERIFGFRYRIEIYVPAAKRVHGYYVLPFLLDGDLVARVDLKADRAKQVLRVRSAHLEESADRHRVATELAQELASMATWLGLEEVTVETRGDLAVDLRAAL